MHNLHELYFKIYAQFSTPLEVNYINYQRINQILSVKNEILQEQKCSFFEFQEIIHIHIL